MGFNLKKVAEAMSGLGGSNSDAVTPGVQDGSENIADASGVGAERDADFSKLAEGDAGVGGGANLAAAEAEIVALKQETAELKDKYLRALAEFENYKKRAIKERSDLLKYQGERVLGDFLEIVDGFERAIEHGGADAGKVIEGVRMIHKQSLDLLGRWEVRAESAMGQQFDPYRHKAISQVPTADTKAGTIVGELKKVYFYKEKLLRYGEVVVATEPMADAPEVKTEGNPEGSGES